MQNQFVQYTENEKEPILKSTYLLYSYDLEMEYSWLFGAKIQFQFNREL